MRKIKTGVIGAGMMGPIHTEALRRLGFVEVVALAEADSKLARAKAEALSISKAYGDYRELLRDDEIEVVHNCTPNHMHYEITRAALEAGKHVVSEKPLAMNSGESRELVRLAGEKGLVNAADFNYRGYPISKHVREFVKAGELGELYLVHGSYLQDWLILPTDYNWRLEPDVGGVSRAVADVGSHWFDMVQYLTGKRVVEVMADLKTIHKTRRKPLRAVETYAGKLLGPEDYTEVEITTEDCATILFRMEGGVPGSLVVSQVSAGRKNRLYYEIDGSRCALSWDQERPNELLVGRREGLNEVLIKDPSLMMPESRAYAHYPGGHPEGYSEGPLNLFTNVYLDVADGKPGSRDYPTFADGHAEVVITEAVLRSFESRSWVEVEE